MSYRNADYDDCPEADELRAEARERRWRLTPCGTCRGTLGSHIAGCPEDDTPPEEPTVLPCPECNGEGEVIHGGERIACSNCDGLAGVDDNGEAAEWVPA